MNVEAASLINCAAYARFDRPPARDARAIMERAICSTGVLKEAVQVTEHYPEPFLLRFVFPHNCADVVGRHEFFYNEHKIHVRPWRLEDNAEQVNMRQHVRICIESVPLYAWTNAVAQQIIRRSCSLDYIEDACKTKVYTKTLCLWAWVEHPGLIPRVRWVTLPGPSGAAMHGRGGLQRRCILHLDILEDMSVDDMPMPGKFEWRWGCVDGERLMRDRTERLLEGDNTRDRERRDEDDDERDRCGRDTGRGWRNSLRRSLSRAAGSRAPDADRSRQGQGDRRERDRSSHGGRRRNHANAAAGVVPMELGTLAVPPSVHLEEQAAGRAEMSGHARVSDGEPVLEDLSEDLPPAAVAPAGAPVLEELVEELLPAAVAPAGALELRLVAASTDSDDEQCVHEGHAAAGDHLMELGMPRHMGFGMDVPTMFGGRGRRPTRSLSPRSSRRRSRASRTPPSTPDPPSSPTSVIPTSPDGKGTSRVDFC